jgi:hypothetical protein
MIILISGVAAIPNSYGSMMAVRDFAEHPTLALVGSALLASSGSLIVGLALIFFPRAVLSHVIKPTEGVSTNALTYNDLQALALTVLGFYFITSGLFDAIYWWARTRLYLEAIGGGLKADWVREEMTGYISAAITIAGGLMVLLGARGISIVLSLLTRRDVTGRGDR